MTAMNQMAFVFEGNHTEEAINRRIDRAMEAYGSIPRTEENYSRAASALIALRKLNGTSEVDILDHMLHSVATGVDIPFAKMAGISSLAVLAGDKFGHRWIQYKDADRAALFAGLPRPLLMEPRAAAECGYCGAVRLRVRTLEPNARWQYADYQSRDDALDGVAPVMSDVPPAKSGWAEIKFGG